MDTPARKALEERVERETRDLLMEGDQAYLSGLSRVGLLEALETELRFLGLYAHEDQETPVMIRDILQQKLDDWIVGLTGARSTKSSRPKTYRKQISN